MTLVSIDTKKALIVTSALAIAGAFAASEKKDAPADIKPALAKDGFDEEQMRLTKIIHKRIVDYQQIKNKTNAGKEQAFSKYKENLKSGASFEMLPIKGGSFTWKGEEKDDVLEVSLSPFWMAQKEVTWEEYEPFMYSKIPRQKDGQVLDFMREQIKDNLDFISRPTTPYHPMTFGMQRDGHPAISMTQHAANKYCQWLSYQTGHFYRLPTEAEWEYACRAGNNTAYSWGDDVKTASQHAWFGGDDGAHYNTPGSKKPNAWGLYDMHGNVMEWTLDQFVPNRKKYFGKDKVSNPWVKATTPYPHVVKGGYWKSKVEDLKAGTRVKSEFNWKVNDPQDPKSIWYHTMAKCPGIRVVRPTKIPTVEEMYHYWNSGVEKDE